MLWVQRPVCAVSGGNISCFYQTRSNRSPHVKEIPRAFTLIDSYDLILCYLIDTAPRDHTAPMR